MSYKKIVSIIFSVAFILTSASGAVNQQDKRSLDITDEGIREGMSISEKQQELGFLSNLIKLLWNKIKELFGIDINSIEDDAPEDEEENNNENEEKPKEEEGTNEEEESEEKEENSEKEEQIPKEENAVIKGYVCESDFSISLSDTEINFYSSKSFDRVLYKTTTDENGIYGINIIPDEYIIVASKGGYETESREISVSSGETKTVDFILRKIPINLSFSIQIIGVNEHRYGTIVFLNAILKNNGEYSVTVSSLSLESGSLALEISTPDSNVLMYGDLSDKLSDNVNLAPGEKHGLTIEMKDGDIDLSRAGRYYIKGFYQSTSGLNISLSSTESTFEISNLSKIYNYSIVNTYPHDKNAYTQGLVFENGYLYESTGRYNKSSIRKLELESGNILQIYNLESKYFGEGIAIFEDKIIQLTWKKRKGFVYDKESFRVIDQFNYTTEGWGITFNGENFIMSDGTSTLYILDPYNYQVVSTINVKDKNGPVDKLNELEYIHGKIYANIYETDNIAIIEPRTGNIFGLIELDGIINSDYHEDSLGVLNGIAYDLKDDRLFVTGKLWPQIFEIELNLK